ncbi:MAG: dephospho-CoA kinase [Gammaproteobacteria bacterium]
MFKLCLTGGIASGKSTAARFLAERGAHVIDADKLGHRVYEPDTEGYRKVIAAFGEEIVAADGQIDRRKLGGLVFGNPQRLKQLTDIVWPEIRKLAIAEMDRIAAQSPDAVVVLEAAVLFEAGWDDVGDQVWVAIVDREVAVERAMQRDGASREAVQNRIDAQLSNDERRRRADVVIDNNGDVAGFEAQLENAWNGLRRSQH